MTHNNTLPGRGARKTRVPASCAAVAPTTPTSAGHHREGRPPAITDALGRRVKKHLNADTDDDFDSFEHLYYNAGWQILETRETASENGAPDAADPQYQFVWSPRHIDAPVLRDENKDADGDCIDGSDERLYYTNDANMNVTALLDTGGDAVERYVYDPYGNCTVYDDDWSDTVTWANSKQNPIRYCGYYFDNETGLCHVRHRSYHPTLGRWVQRDPGTSNTLGGHRHAHPDIQRGDPPTAEYVDGLNLYEYVGTSPTMLLDPQGLRKTDIKLIDYLVKKHGLSKYGREELHRAIRELGKHASKKAIETEAKSIAKLGGKFIKGAGLVFTVAIVIHETAEFAYAPEKPVQPGELPSGASYDDCIRCVVVPFDAEVKATQYLFGLGAKTEVLRHFQLSRSEDRGCMTRAECRELYVDPTLGPPSKEERGCWTWIRHYTGGQWTSWADPGAEVCP